METQKLEGQFALLPNGERVVIETVTDAKALVRRLHGKRRKTTAICALSNLKIIDSRQLTKSETQVE